MQSVAQPHIAPSCHVVTPLSDAARMPFRPSLVAHSKQRSSPWVARQIRDPYVKQRACGPAHYRSRSAFKLLEINAQYGHFLTKPDVQAVVDLGAAPGGWSQVVASQFGHGAESSSWRVHKPRVFAYGSKLENLQDKWGTWSSGAQESFDLLNIDDEVLDSGEDDKDKDKDKHRSRRTIVAVDLLHMQPIPGVEFVQADFLAPRAAEMIHALLKLKGNSDGWVDVVLSDMAANASGNDTRDIEASLEISNAVFEFAKRHLRTAEAIGRRKGGVLLMKHFTHPSLQQFREERLERSFHEVRFIKPPSSRTESREGFFLCRGWKG